MPLTVNVGLSRKASKNYQSTGLSINITAELDQALLAHPVDLQRQIDLLYGQAEEALAHQTRNDAPLPTPNRQASGNGNGSASVNGRGNGNGRFNRHQASGNQRPANGHGNANTNAPGLRGQGNTHPATQSQRRAIEAVGRRLGLDLDDECAETQGCDLERLTVQQASALITHLRSLEPSTPHNGAPR